MLLRRVLPTVVMAMLCSLAWATLGRTPWPSARNTTATLSVLPLNAYSEWTTVLQSGTVVHEYANALGQVFAVHWDGPLLPDLTALLGDYAGEYQQAAQQRRDAGQRGGMLQTKKSHIVVISRGRMGQFNGYAYLPALVPIGVDAEALLQ
jgi:Protein of unknown function (DUF2844)